MTERLRAWWLNHLQAWTCLHGWSRAICIVDDLAHMLHLPLTWLCDLHDGRLMRTMDEEGQNDLHDSAIRRWWDDGEAVELAELGTTIAYETWPRWENTSTSTATVEDVKITYRSDP